MQPPHRALAPDPPLKALPTAPPLPELEEWALENARRVIGAGSPDLGDVVQNALLIAERALRVNAIESTDLHPFVRRAVEVEATLAYVRATQRAHMLRAETTLSNADIPMRRLRKAA